MDDERRPMKAWGSRLGGEGEPVTMAEGHFLAAMMTCDLLRQHVNAMNTSLADMADRLARLETYLEKIAPGYAEHSANVTKVLQEGRV